MSTTIMNNAITTGVRRLSTLGAWGLGTVDPDTLTQLQAAGYDMGAINTAIALGATDDQLLNLPFPASPDEIAAATQQLLNQLGGALPSPGAPSSSAGSYPAGAVPTTLPTSTAFGTYDLMQRSSWDALSNQFVSTQQSLNYLGRTAPKDPDVISMVTQFNNLVGQWANYYDEAFGSAPSNIPFASTLGGLGIAPLVIVTIAGAVVAVLAALYLINQQIAAKTAMLNAQTASTTATAQAFASAAAQSQASSLNTQAQTLTNQANALPAGAAQTTLLNQAAALRTQATQLLGQSAAVLTPPGLAPAAPTNWSLWLQQNMGLLIAGLAAVVVIPAVAGRRR